MGIGYRWKIYHQRSDANGDGTAAAGVVTSASAAKGLVEFILRCMDEAAFGILVRIADERLPEPPEPEPDWPPPGVTMTCTRTVTGSLRWAPLYRGTIVPGKRETLNGKETMT